MADNSFYRYDLDCEKAVLGTLLLERDAIHKVREILNIECFYDKFHKDVYKAILSLTDKGDRADTITIMAELTKLGVTFKPFDIANLSSNSTFDLTQYSLYLSDLEKSRRMYDIGQYLVTATSKGAEDVSDILQKVTDDLSSVFGDSVNHVKTAADYLEDVYKRVSDNLNGATTKGSVTGFKEIDDKGGFQPTNLIICAAESSQGKTALANAITLAAARSGESIAFYSMEMTGEQLMTRLTAIDSNIPGTLLSNGKLTAEQLKTFDKALPSLQKLKIYFDDRSTSNIETIISSIRSMAMKHNIKGAVIDYLQILNVNKKGNANGEELLADAARRLKNLAKELNIWILALSQLNRDSINPSPSVNRLRGSGQINEAADITMLLYRPEVYQRRYNAPFESTETKGTALIDIAKGRNIGTFKFIAGFDASTTKFYNLDERPILPFTPQQKDDEPF